MSRSLVLQGWRLAKRVDAALALQTVVLEAAPSLAAVAVLMMMAMAVVVVVVAPLLDPILGPTATLVETVTAGATATTKLTASQVQAVGRIQVAQSVIDAITWAPPWGHVRKRSPAVSVLGGPALTAKPVGRMASARMPRICARRAVKRLFPAPASELLFAGSVDLSAALAPSIV